MDQRLKAALFAFRHLDEAKASTGGPPCKVCRATSEFFGVTGLNKCVVGYRLRGFEPVGVNVIWYRRPVCGFVITKFLDNWTEDDFAQLVYNDEHIKIDGGYLGARAERMATEMAKLLHG